MSVVFSVLVILFFYGYLTPYGLDPNAILGPQYAQLLGSGALSQGATTGPASMIAPFLPGGVTGLIIYTVLRKSGGVSRAMMAPSTPSANEMMKQMNIEGMMTRMNSIGAMGGGMGVPSSLPADITTSQFVILRGYRRGMKSSKDVADALSMQASDVDAETAALVSNGYLSSGMRLTSKAMNLLGN